MGGDGRSFDRYPPHGRKPAKEEAGVQWGRIRAPPVGTPAHELHASDCLEALRPGDHFEIQWRKNKDFPYGTTVPLPGPPACSAGDGERCPRTAPRFYSLYWFKYFQWLI